MTGLSMANSNLESKRLEALKDAFSALKRVMILYDPTMGVSGLIDAQSGTRALAIELLIVEAGDPAQFDTVFARAADQGANGLAAMAPPFLNFHRKQLIELAAQHHFPSIWETPGLSETAGFCPTARAFLTCIDDLLVTLLRFCVALDRVIFQSNSRLSSSLQSILKPPRRWASTCPRRCSPAPTR